MFKEPCLISYKRGCGTHTRESKTLERVGVVQAHNSLQHYKEDRVLITQITAAVTTTGLNFQAISKGPNMHVAVVPACHSF